MCPGPGANSQLKGTIPSSYRITEFRILSVCKVQEFMVLWNDIRITQ